MVAARGVRHAELSAVGWRRKAAARVTLPGEAGRFFGG
jgi:hypothetical protein